nr:MAG TPA: hypothetical protein [Caudoviricetes sp.]
MPCNARFFFDLTVTKVTAFECVRGPKKCLYGRVRYLYVPIQTRKPQKSTKSDRNE